MKSNHDKYTKVSFVETLNETTAAADAGTKSGLLLSPGAYPVCSKCGKDCKTLTNEKNHLLTGTENTLNSPMVCQSCNSVICEECANNRKMACPQCDAQHSLSMLVPFVFCDTCGKRAALMSSARPGEATYMQLDQGAIPLRCTKCQAINCVSCLSNTKVCQKCGASELDFFVPGYDGTGVVIAAIGPNDGFVTLAAPSSDAAKKAKAAQNTAQKEEEKKESDSCFIATAAFGTKDAKEVVCLRHFRDNVLKQTNFGKAIVSLYENISPPMARYIKQSPLLRTFVRVFLVRPSSRIASIFLSKRNEA